MEPLHQLLINSSREIRDGNVVFVGMGLPVLVALYAQKHHAPKSKIINEYGIIDPILEAAPEVADPSFSQGALQYSSMLECLGWLITKVDLAIMGAAQVDRYGNVNTTAIGDYNRPRIRLAGSGGGNDMASLARRVIIVMDRQDPSKMPERVDYITSPGYLGGRGQREALGLPGGGPIALYTDKALYRFDERGEMYVAALYQGVVKEEVAAGVGWEIRFAEELEVLPRPSPEEVKLLKALDPHGVYLRT